MKKLTRREAEILDWIMHRLRCCGPPSNNEIKDYFKVTSNAISRHVCNIVTKGYLGRDHRDQLCAKVSDHWYNKEQKRRDV